MLVLPAEWLDHCDANQCTSIVSFHQFSISIFSFSKTCVRVLLTQTVYVQGSVWKHRLFVGFVSERFEVLFPCDLREWFGYSLTVQPYTGCTFNGGGFR